MHPQSFFRWLVICITLSTASCGNDTNTELGHKVDRVIMEITTVRKPYEQFIVLDSAMDFANKKLFLAIRGEYGEVTTENYGPCPKERTAVDSYDCFFVEYTLVAGGEPAKPRLVGYHKPTAVNVKLEQSYLLKALSANGVEINKDRTISSTTTEKNGESLTVSEIIAAETLGFNVDRLDLIDVKKVDGSTNLLQRSFSSDELKIGSLDEEKVYKQENGNRPCWQNWNPEDNVVGLFSESIFDLGNKDILFFYRRVTLWFYKEDRTESYELTPPSIKQLKQMALASKANETTSKSAE